MAMKKEKSKAKKKPVMKKVPAMKKKMMKDHDCSCGK
jgi:hypothetical protein